MNEKDPASQPVAAAVRTPAASGDPGASEPRGRLSLSPRNLNRLRIVLTAVTVLSILWYLKTRPPFHASDLSWHWNRFIAAGLCLPALLALRALKWFLLLRRSGEGVTYFQALGSFLGALALGLVTPGRVGEYSRGLYLPQPELQGWRGAGLVLLDNWNDFLAVLVWACLGWFWWLGMPGLAAGVGLTLVFLPVPLWLKGAARVTDKLPSRWRFQTWIQGGLSAGLRVPVGDWLRALGVSVAAYGLEWLQFAALLGFLTETIPSPVRLAGIMALVTLANSFQLTLAGLGVREGLTMLLLGREGVGSEAAVLAAFLQTALNLFLPALGGLAVRPVALDKKASASPPEKR